MTDGQSAARVAPASPGGLERVLGRADLVLFTVCAILTIDTLATSAAMGVAWFSWWLITMTVFFIPYGFITAELGAAWPGEGGVYIWVREAFGPKWGSTAAWLYWINNAYWLPSLFWNLSSPSRTMPVPCSTPPGVRFPEPIGPKA